MTKIIQIKKNILNRKIKIGVIGLGYVGLPLVIQLINKDYKVIGFDTDKEKINTLNNSRSYIKHISNRAIIKILKKGFFATKDWSLIKSIDIIIICVPTPLTRGNTPDLSYLTTTLDSITSHFKKGQLLIIESTSYPGTTTDIVLPRIQKIGYKVGKNYFLSFSPEREDPGNQNFSYEKIPKIVSGVTKNCLQITKTFYDEVFDKTVTVSSTETAEMTKLLENIYRSVNIGLVNEIKMIADKMDINIYEVIEAASTKPFGFKPFFPGPGLGGHCIPIDPYYLSWKAKKIGIKTHLIETAGKINNEMPNWIVNKTKEQLELKEINILNAKILVLGIAYKKNIDDIRESPSLVIIDLLLKEGALVDYHDPLVKSMVKTRKYSFQLKSVSLKYIQNYDCVILATDHDDLDYQIIEKKSRILIDTRGKFRNSLNVIHA